ncbi:MAG: LIC12048 family lipoprotein [Leptospirales bacterium]
MNKRTELNRKKSFSYFFVGVFFLLSIIFTHCGGKANVEAVSLKTKTVDTTDKGDTGTGTDAIIPVHELFASEPGQVVKLSSFGLISPVGTLLADDYDGDGISNTDEIIHGKMMSNFWIADYPVIESNIAAPVTMKIEILKDVNGLTSEISSNISTDDVESRRNEGSEKFHQDELTTKTVQYTEKSSKSNTSSFGIDVGGPAAALATGTSLGLTASDSSSKYTETEVFETRPFKNNIDREATSVKSDSAQNNARKYRQEKRSKVDTNSKVSANAGTIRAALYIKNHSVNMPVHLTNITCTLLFETAQGELIPVKSFTLLNPDYSVFSVDVYGSSEFGPYVIELTDLNTVEIEQAIAKGYTPKIYIVDYTMNHVPDSNYRSVLSSSFTGDNLKIIEENAKGRTALLKIFAPNIREMLRVVAFTVENEIENDACAIPVAPTYVDPGVSMKRTLDRIACSGISIEYGHYIFDYTDTEYEINLPNPVVYTQAIKSIDGHSNTFPCQPEEVAGVDIDGKAITACIIKMSDLTEEEYLAYKFWFILDNGKYYDANRYALDDLGNIKYFDADKLVPIIPIVAGVNSKVWAGDNYDITYMSIADIVGAQIDFGKNLVETADAFNLNSNWNNETLGFMAFHPVTNSVYLGKVALGDLVDIEVTLNDTSYLNPSFGSPTILGSTNIYNTFTYNLQKELNSSFTHENAFDIEVSFGLGGAKENWYNITRTDSAAHHTDTNSVTLIPTDCGQAWNYVDQKFTVCLEVPSSLPGAGFDGMVDLYIRTTPNNAYREVIWPEEYQKVKKFKGDLANDYATGATFIEVENGTGNLAVGAYEQGATIQVGANSYTISSVSAAANIYTINLQSALAEDHLINEKVFIEGDLTETKVVINQDTNFITDWNADAAHTSSGIYIPDDANYLYTASPNGCTYGLDSLFLLSPGCQGYIIEPLVANWVGSSTFANDWNDSSGYDTYLSKSLNPYLQNATGSSINVETQPNLYITLNDTHKSATGTPQSFVHGDKTIVVWDSFEGVDKDIRARIIDTATGYPLTDEFIVNEVTAGDQTSPAVFANGTNAIVTWTSGTELRARRLDLTQNPPVVVPEVEFSASVGNMTSLKSLIADGDTVFALWNSGLKAITGRLMSISGSTAGAGYDAPFLIKSSANFNIQRANAYIKDGVIVVTWDRLTNTTRHDVYAIAYDVKPFTIKWPETQLTDTNIAHIQWYPTASIYNGQVVIAYYYMNTNNSSNQSSFRIVNINTGIPGARQRFDTRNLTWAINGNIAFYYGEKYVLWTWPSKYNGTNWRNVGRIYNRNTDTWSGEFDLPNATTNADFSFKTNGDLAMFSWRKTSDNQWYGQIYDLTNTTPVAVDGTMFSIYNQSNTACSMSFNSGSERFFFCSDFDGVSTYDVSGQKIFVDTKTPIGLQYGMNNFFKSPLIERNYTIKARLRY